MNEHELEDRIRDLFTHQSVLLDAIHEDRGVANLLDGPMSTTAENTSNHLPAVASPSTRPRWVLAGATAAVLVLVVGFVATRPAANGSEIGTTSGGQGGVDASTPWQYYVLPGETLLSEAPLVVAAAPGDDPDFDTSGLGQRLEFVPITDIDDDVAALISQPHPRGEDRVTTKVTLLGRVEGEPWVLRVTDGPEEPMARAESDDGSPSPSTNLRGRYLLSTDSGFGSGDFALTESLDMIAIPEADSVPTGQGAGLSTPTGWVTWDSLPSNVAVVSFTDSDQKWWIVPSAGVAVFPAQFDDGERFTLQAFASDGRPMGSYGETVDYAADARAAEPKVGEKIDVIGGSDIAGNPLVVEANGRPTLFVYGASWCIPCSQVIEEALPVLDALGDTVNVYAVPYYTEADDAWPTDPEWPYPRLWLNPNNRLRDIGAVPSVLVLDGTNVVIGVIHSFDDLAAELAKLGITPAGI